MNNAPLKLIEVAPWLNEVSLDQLVYIHIKTIPGLIADEQPKYRRGKKVRKRWFVSQQDKILGRPCFCKEYFYSVSEEGRLTITTKCIWFNVENKIAHEKQFVKVFSKGSTDYETSKYRQIMVSLLKTDAAEIPGLNGQALNIFKKYKDQIENYYEFSNAKQDWIDSMENETDTGILSLLNIELPVYYVNNIYEEALTQERILPILFQNTGVFPFKGDGTLKNQIELYTEFYTLGIDLNDLSSIIQYMLSVNVDVRFINIKNIIIELLTSD